MKQSTIRFDGTPRCEPKLRRKPAGAATTSAPTKPCNRKRTGSDLRKAGLSAQGEARPGEGTRPGEEDEDLPGLKTEQMTGAVEKTEKNTLPAETRLAAQRGRRTQRASYARSRLALIRSCPPSKTFIQSSQVPRASSALLAAASFVTAPDTNAEALPIDLPAGPIMFLAPAIAWFSTCGAAYPSAGTPRSIVRARSPPCKRRPSLLRARNYNRCARDDSEGAGRTVLECFAWKSLLLLGRTVRIYAVGDAELPGAYDISLALDSN